LEKKGKGRRHQLSLRTGVYDKKSPHTLRGSVSNAK